MNNETIKRERARLAAEKSRKQDILDTITEEEIDALIEKVESFEGTPNTDSTARFEQMQSAAKLLFVRSAEVKDYTFSPPDTTRRNATVRLTLGSVNCLTDEDERLWKHMTSLADHFYFTVNAEKNIVVSFAVEDTMD